MNRLTKALAIVATVWAAAMLAIIVAFVANRPSHLRVLVPAGGGGCIEHDPATGLCTKLAPNLGRTTTVRGFAWGGMWAWVGVVTLIAGVAVVIILIVTNRRPAPTT